MALPHPGPTDSILDVAGLHVGQVEIGASDACPAGATGITAVVVPQGALGAVDVRGAAPGTRETDTLSVLASGERVHAVLLVGRSVFGLAAADGATTELERRGIGLPIGRGDVQLRIPIVASAVIFDFLHGDPAIRPGPADGERAVATALDGPCLRPRSGNAGAGAGAATGGLVPPRLKGGVGHASLVASVAGGPGIAGVAGGDGDELVVGAVVVVNSSGSLVDASGRPWAAAGGFDVPAGVPDFATIASSRSQTTLAVVATNAALDKAQLARVAAMAHDGLARAIRPVHTGVDGDAVFALSVTPPGGATSRGPGEPGVADPPPGAERRRVLVHAWAPAAASIVGSLAADAVTRAVLDALANARSSGGISSLAGTPPNA